MNSASPHRAASAVLTATFMIGTAHVPGHEQAAGHEQIAALVDTEAGAAASHTEHEEEPHTELREPVWSASATHVAAVFVRSSYVSQRRRIRSAAARIHRPRISSPPR